MHGARLASRIPPTLPLHRDVLPAGFSKRLSADTAVEVIGGADTYAPMCRSCFYGGPLARSPRPIHLPSPVPGSSDSPTVVAASPEVTAAASGSPASAARPSPQPMAGGAPRGLASAKRVTAMAPPVNRKLDMGRETRRANSSSDSSEAAASNEETKSKAAAAGVYAC